MPTINQSFQLVKNMGWRYLSFRLIFELEKRLGLFKRKFPKSPSGRCYISLKKWRTSNLFFGVCGDEERKLSPSNIPSFQSYAMGEYTFFSARKINLGSQYDWITNPDTGYRYDTRAHWSEVQDFSSQSGDIKYVWEKSRFSYLHDVIRYDHYKQEDHSAWVFSEIGSWLKANPINCGPNYKCSQEISIRILNWTYALHYYKHSPYLTDILFQRVMHAIYWQLKHVYTNINFSRIAVRNNHAITETLTLYLCGLFYPFFPEADIWKKHGKKWFEEEIAYQIYPDGTFLQFSMNYHRVVIQLLCWALRTADFFKETFEKVVYERAYKSLQFLHACQDEPTGWLPNYGNNDGALFFKLTSCDYRDYRPQLNTLHILLTGQPLYEDGDWQEEAFWFKAHKVTAATFPSLQYKEGWFVFESGGYYVLREKDCLTFLRCGKHKDRPAQADNLHLDIWHKGQNILFDGGSFKYNTSPEMTKYFMGTASHNTVMLDDHDQMLKGARFIWYNWSQAIKGNVSDTEDEYCFQGEISAFTFLKSSIRHVRTVRKLKGKATWVVEDRIVAKPDNVKICQLWHSLSNVKLESNLKNGDSLVLKKIQGWRSDYYGIKTPSDQFVAITESNELITTITVS